MVGTGILAKHKNCIGLFKIIHADGAFADADALLEANATGFVAHIGTIREVAGAQHPAKQLIKVGGFIAGAT
ncbi:hypothetical protein D3C75_948240 [compost metagenome]